MASETTTAKVERRYTVTIPNDTGSWTYRYWDGGKWKTGIDCNSKKDAEEWCKKQKYQAFRLVFIPAESESQ